MFMPIKYRDHNWPLDSHELIDRTREFSPWVYQDGNILWPETGEAIIIGCPQEIAEEVIRARAAFARAMQSALNVEAVSDGHRFQITNVDQAAEAIGQLTGEPEFRFEANPDLCRKVFKFARNGIVTAGQIRKYLGP